MRRLALLALALLISGCSADTEDIIPQSGPTMSDIYNQALKNRGQGAYEPAGLGRPATPQVAPPDDPRSYTRTAENEIDNLFPTLQNPTLVMYVFPHLTSDERLPVPGYATSFPLYERPEFALPGEAPAAARPTTKSKKIRILSGSSEPSSIRRF